MAKTLAQIHKQIASLQRQADAIKAREMVGVIERIRDAVGHYGLTVEHVFGVTAARTAAPQRAMTPGKHAAGKKAAAKPSQVKGTKAPVKYRDGEGHTWSGRGSQPRWLRFAIEDGASLVDFEVHSK